MNALVEQTVGRIGQLAPFPQPELILTRYPVVLMHGFGALASIRRGGHLHEEAMYLRERGVLAFAPNVAPYNTVKVRSATWKQYLERVLEETGAERLNLIAQSMGGLDARYLISCLGMAQHVESLVTISTPHHGTSIATFVLEQPQRLRDLAAAVANWMGTKTLPGSEADFTTAVGEFTPEFVCDRFNPSVPDDPSVRYWSYAGLAGKGTGVIMNPFLRFLNGILYEREGFNDGFVSVESAKWGRYLGTVDADHAEQVGIQIVPGSRFRVHEFYADIVRKLAAEGA